MRYCWGYIVLVYYTKCLDGYMYEVDTDTFKRKLTTSGALKKLDILYNQLYRNKNTQIYI